MTSYEYVRRMYPNAMEPIVGRRVFHTVTGNAGEVRREDKSQSHYVMVRFDGLRHSLPCHPEELRPETIPTRSTAT